MNIDDEYRSFESQLKEGKLLHIEADGKKILEMLAPSYKGLFYALCEWSEIEISSLFDGEPFVEDERQYIKANGEKIEYKEIYQKKELEQPIRNISFGSKVGQKIIYTASNPTVQKETLDKLCGRELYISFLSLFYRNSNNEILNSPLLFLRVDLSKKDGKYILQIVSDGPIFNDTLIRYVKTNYNIDLYYDAISFDIYDYVNHISHKISGLMWGVDYASFMGEFDLLECNRISKILNMGQSIFANSSIRTLLNEYKPVSTANIYQDIDESLDKYSLAVINSTDEGLEKSLLDSLITKSLKAQGSVLVLNGQKYFDNYVSSLGIEFLVDRYNPFAGKNSIYDIYQGIKKDKYEINVDEELYTKIIETQENFLMLEENIVDYDIPTGETLSKMINTMLDYKTKSTNSLSILLASDYDRLEFAHDREVLVQLDKSDSIKNCILTEHPFYGLEAENTIECFNKLKSVLENLEEDVREFYLKIQELCKDSHGFVNVEKIRDYDEYVAHFELFSEYSGFPLEYFDYDDDERLLQALSGAKNGYIVLGSLKLSIENLTSNDFFNKDWKDILNKAINKDKASKKMLKKALKIRSKASYNSLVKLLTNYYTNKEGTEKYIQVLKDEYHFSSTDMDAIIACEEAMDYISNFVRHTRLYDKVDFRNDFVKKLFLDDDYRRRFRNEIFPTLESLRAKIDSDLSDFKEYNPHDYNDYTDVDFKELEHAFDNKINASYKIFSEYCDFSSKLKDASQNFKDFLNDYSDLDVTMGNFENDFMYSLYVAISERIRSCYGGKEEWTNIIENYLSLLPLMNVTFGIKDLISTVSDIKEKLDKDEYYRTLNELVSIYKRARVTNPNVMSERYFNTLSEYLPLASANSHDIYAFNNVKYDLVVICDSSSLSSAELLNAMLLGRKVLIFNFKNDEKIVPLKLGYSNLLKHGEYEKINEVLDKLFDGLNMSFEVVKDYKLSDEDTIPLSLVRTGSTIPSFVIIPDIVYLNAYGSLEELVRDILINLYDASNITPLVINSLELAIASDKNMYLRSVINGLMDQKKVYDSGEEDQKEESEKHSPSDKQKYLERLTNIYNGFDSYPTQEEIDLMLKNEEYDELFKEIQPLLSTRLMKYGQEFCQYVLDRQKEETIVLNHDRYFVDPSLPIKVKKSLADQRGIDDVSKDEMIRAIYAYLANFSFLHEKVLINELIHVFRANADEVIFKELYQDSITYLINNGYIEKNGKKLSLKQ